MDNQTAAFNERGQKAYLRASFKEIGRRKKSVLLNQQRYDDILMDCLAEEFKPPVVVWKMPF